LHPAVAGKKEPMDLPNAFIGRNTPPSETELAYCLGPSLPVWNDLLAWLESQGIACGEWKSVSPKYGWGLRPALGKRTILYLGPCQGCFRVSLVLGDKAIAAARVSDLPKSFLKEIASAKRYAEGTGVRLFVHDATDITTVRTLVGIKLAS
jgi:hypothetical protein